MASGILLPKPMTAAVLRPPAVKRGKVDRLPDANSKPKERPRLKRKTPKVKTGCFTCRTRRVKCDEGKPVCMRCIKFGISCDGYPIPVSKPKSTIRPIIPKVHFLVSKERPKPKALLSQHIHVGPRFTDASEYRYFLYYCQGISGQIGGPFKARLWNHLIPQAGEDEPFIGRAIIALGALSKSQSSRRQRQTPPSENPHHQYALSQYCKALSGMRKSLQVKPSDNRKILIGVLLVFCFESLQGHQSAAAAHASSGINLVMNLCNSCKPKPWKFAELGEEFYAAFSNLDLQGLLYHDRRPKADHGFYKKGIGAVIATMPNKFPDLQECRRFWHYIMRRNLHFSLEVRDAISSHPAANPFTSYEFPNMTEWWNPWVDHTQATTLQSIFLLSERDLYVQDICHWEIASAPLLCRLFSSSLSAENNEYEQTEDFLIASLLRIHAAMSIVLLTRAFNPSETEYDKFEDQFMTIVELSERVHHLLVSPPHSPSHVEGEEGSNSTFRFDIGILPALSQVGLLCREKGIRGRAIKFLRESRGYKEGIWDAEAVGAINDWIRGVEEEYWVEGEGIPGNRRCVLVGCEKELERRWARVRVKQGDGRDGWIQREDVVRW